MRSRLESRAAARLGAGAGTAVRLYNSPIGQGVMKVGGKLISNGPSIGLGVYLLKKWLEK